MVEGKAWLSMPMRVVAVGRLSDSGGGSLGRKDRRGCKGERGGGVECS